MRGVRSTSRLPLGVLLAAGAIAFLPATAARADDEATLPPPAVAPAPGSAPVVVPQASEPLTAPQATNGAYVGVLPTVCGCRTRREHVPAPVRGRMEVQTFTRVNPTYRNWRVPQYRTEYVPVYEWRDTPAFQVRRTPRYEDITVKIYGWRDVPQVVERKHEVWEEVERPRLVTKEIPAERYVVDEVYEYGEEPIERTVKRPTTACQTDPQTGRTCRVTTGEQECTVNEGTRRFKALQGFHGEVRPRGVRLEWVQEGTFKVREFRGVRVEKVVQGTRRERVVVGERVERRCVGMDEERIPCGTRRERVKVGEREVKKCVGWLPDRERIGNEEETVTYGWECSEEPCGRAGTRPVREPVSLPELRVTVVPDGAVGYRLLPGTTTMMEASRYAAEQARRATLVSPR
ncbi:MAG: hypothetical protein R3E85_05495 [Planctomycetota bacterium]